MNDAEVDELFLDGDEEHFRSIVEGYIKKGAPDLHKMTPRGYVERCRQVWRSCDAQVDEVFQLRMLIDKKVRGRPPRAFERRVWPEGSVDDDPHTEWGDLYCCVAGMMDLRTGKFVGAPGDYSPPPLPSEDPTSRRVVLTGLDDPGYESAAADSPDPANYALALLDVLGFKRLLQVRGLDGTKAIYDRLIEVALQQHAASGMTPYLHPVGPDAVSPGLFWLPVKHAHFSDSLLLWVACRPQYVTPFLDRCIEVYCQALEIGVPLRGAVAFGRAVLHGPSSTFLGQPLIDLVQMEHAQEWTGIMVGRPPQELAPDVPIFPLLAMPYDAPMKVAAHTEHLQSGLVLDWPRRWRDTKGTSPVEQLQGIRAEGFTKYYDNAITFAAFSDEHSDWFLRHMPKPPP